MKIIRQICDGDYVMLVFMKENGFAFCLSKNGVWLTKEAPVKYLEKQG